MQASCRQHSALLSDTATAPPILYSTWRRVKGSVKIVETRNEAIRWHCLQHRHHSRPQPRIAYHADDDAENVFTKGGECQSCAHAHGLLEVPPTTSSVKRLQETGAHFHEAGVDW